MIDDPCGSGRLGSYALLLTDNPLSQKCRTILEFDVFKLASRTKIHRIAIDKRHLCKVSSREVLVDLLEVLALTLEWSPG